MNTLVYVMFNGGASENIFDIPLKEFKEMWDTQIRATGYFEGVNRDGNRVVINPSQCPVIEIRRFKY